MSESGPLEDLDRAIGVAAEVVAGVRPDQWTAATPCTELDARELLDHMVTGNLLFTALLRGAAPPDRAADHLGDDPAGAFRAASAGLTEAFAAPGALERTYTAPFGTGPGIALLQVRVVEMLVHGWDLARATGQDADFPDDVAARALVASRGALRAARDRPGAPFAAEVMVAEDAPAMDRLVAYLGRHP